MNNVSIARAAVVLGCALVSAGCPVDGRPPLKLRRDVFGRRGCGMDRE